MHWVTHIFFKSKKSAQYESYQYLIFFKILQILHLPIFLIFFKYTNMVLPILFIGKLENTNIFEILVSFFEYW